MVTWWECHLVDNMMGCIRIGDYGQCHLVDNQVMGEVRERELCIVSSG